MIAHTSLFAQVRSLIDRKDFYRSAQEHQAEKHAKGFHLLGAVCLDDVLSARLGKLATRDNWRSCNGNGETFSSRLKECAQAFNACIREQKKTMAVVSRCFRISTLAVS